MMIDQAMLWRQFGATIDMFGNALRDCPDELWEQGLWMDPSMGTKFSTFWYVSYHTLFWLDLYLTGEVEGFVPPAPFTLDELDPAGVLPPQVYTREELLDYLEHCRQKCQETIGALTHERADHLCRFPGENSPLQSFFWTICGMCRSMARNCACS